MKSQICVIENSNMILFFTPKFKLYFLTKSFYFVIIRFPIRCVVRLWDTYISEPSGFENFHVYVCATFLIYWAPQLKVMEFQDFMLFMQKLPTGEWEIKEIETIVSEAFVLQQLFHDAPNHLKSDSA